MKFKTASEVEQVCYELKLGDFPRGSNRARINDLFNGVPPYSDEEAARSRIKVNVNFLEGTRLAHDARSQFYGAFLKPGQFFTATTDGGAPHKRGDRGHSMTRIVNKFMKRSMNYFETFRSSLALDVLHGIGPSGWDTDDYWCPDALGVEDVLIPAQTLLTMKNLPFFAIYRSYTASELLRLTRGPNVDSAWNMDLVEKLIKWVDKEALALMGSNWPEVWSPEKLAERVKGDGGFYAGDQVPTIDCFDFRFYDDDGKNSGWRRRIILDSWSTPGVQGATYTMGNNTDLQFAKGQWLYNSKNRKYADTLSEQVCFQFADLSSVAPFRYHSVRSLGFMLYAVCHLQNRLRCSFTESVFEALLNYLRVRSAEDAERALSIELANRGILDETVQFVPQAERWNVNSNLVELGLRENAALIQQNSSSWTQNQSNMQDRTEKTKFQVMAEVQAMTSLVSAALTQAYAYANFQYREILRRFLNKHSRDVDVQKARALMIKADIPERLLVIDAWDTEPERVMGSGNKTLEMAIAQNLMEYRSLYDPEPQRKILRDFTLAITDDPARANEYVPAEPHITDTIHDTELVFGSLLIGSPVTPKPGLNAIEVIGTMLRLIGGKVAEIKQMGGVGTPQDVAGLSRAAQYTDGFIKILAEQKDEKQRVAAAGKELAKQMNEVRAFAQRQQEMAQKAAKQNGQQMDPKDAAKIEAIKLQAQVDAQNRKESHADRTAQKRLAFEQKMQQEEQKAKMDLVSLAAKTRLQ